MKRLLLGIALLLMATVANAQVTTSSIRGHVTTNDDSLPGATIVACHTPSGTEYGTTTNSEGIYTLRGLRVGGPYTITISFLGYRSVTYADIELSLGTIATFDAEMEPASLDVEDIVVIGSVDNTVGNMTFSNKTMELIPSVDRSIYDLTRLMPGAVSPAAGGIVLAGQSTRYNAFTIDGTSAADIYGLGTTGMTGSLTRANPIPLDALALVELSSSPIDLRESGFTGGGINAVTRSGDNGFRGSAYTYFNNERFYGTTPGRDVEERRHLSEQMTSIVGLTLSGSLVENKLFFFLAGEFNRNITPSTNHPSSGVSALTLDEAERIATHYKSLTGYDGGGYGEHNVLALTGSAVARLDWNINDNNRLSLRYNMLHADADASSNSAQSFYFTGSEYTNINRTHSLVAELNSSGDWGMNTLRVGYTLLRDGRTTEESLPAVIINSLGERGNGSATIGTNPYSGCNMLSQNIFIIGDDLTLTRGRHTITVGTSNEIYRADNLYLANAQGTYTYASIDDFLADNGTSGGHATQYAYNYFLDGKRNPPMTMAQFALYAQDEVELARHLHLTYGLRVDMPVMFDTPQANEEFNNGHFVATYGTKTGDIPRTQLLLSPRIGIEWLNEGLTLRGSAGIYTGRIPFVWLANCYQNNGMRSVGVTVTNHNDTPAFSLNPESVGIASNPAIDLVDSKFRYPQVFRVAATARYTLGGWAFQADADYTKGINNIYVENLAAEDKGQRLYVGGDNRRSATYYSPNTSAYSAVYRLSNTQRGYSWSATARLEYNFREQLPGLEFMAAYTYTVSRSINDGISAQSSSNWGRTYTVDSNSPTLSSSVYEFPHKVVASLSYSRRYGLFGTNVMLLYNGYSGEHYSLTYARGKTDENGDTYRGNMLIYIPTKEEMGSMLWADDSSAAAFDSYIEADRYLKSHRGEFAERNSHSLPFVSRLDLHVAQSFYFDKKSQRHVELSLDVINLGNLISRSWGAVHRTSNWALSPVTITELVATDGGYRPVYKFTGAEYTTDDIASRWHMQIGLRVVF